MMEFKLNQIQKNKLPFKKREGEKKIGDTIHILEDSPTEESLKNYVQKNKIKYIIIGVEEDIGPRANLGKGGANNAYEAFLNKFLNLPSNQHYNGQNTLILGSVDLEDLMMESTWLDNGNGNDLKILRQLCEESNERVTYFVKLITETKAIPIILGGGDNNTYAAIKGIIINNEKTHAVNIDPHFDFRKMEGYHSGNSFRYVLEQNLLEKMFVVGVGEQSNNQEMFDKIKEINQQGEEKIGYNLFEELIRKEKNFTQLVNEAIQFFNKKPEHKLGIGFDNDSLTRAPASALNYNGLTLREGQEYVHRLVKEFKGEICYFLITEGAPTNKEEMIETGQIYTKLVLEFLKTHEKKKRKLLI